MKSLATAYAVKKRAKKMAHGGMMTHEGYQSECTAECESPCMVHEKAEYMPAHEEDHKRPNHMAIEQDDKMLGQHGDEEMGPEGRHMAEGGEVDDEMHQEHMAKKEQERHQMHTNFMNEHKRIMDMGHQTQAHDEDMVGRIMKKREHMYSRGGVVANSDEPEADFMPDEFDDLHLDDHLEAKYSGSNEHGDKYGADHKDPVAMVMMKRKKQRNPQPA